MASWSPCLSNSVCALPGAAKIALSPHHSCSFVPNSSPGVFAVVLCLGFPLSLQGPPFIWADCAQLWISYLGWNQYGCVAPSHPFSTSSEEKLTLTPSREQHKVSRETESHTLLIKIAPKFPRFAPLPATLGSAQQKQWEPKRTCSDHCSAGWEESPHHNWSLGLG